MSIDNITPGTLQIITTSPAVMHTTSEGAARTDTLRLNASPKTSTYGGLVFQPTTVTP